MIVYYFGADGPWSQENQFSIRRRNMAILNALSNQQSITKVFNIVRSSRNLIFKNRNLREVEDSKIENIFIAPIIPERGILKQFTRPINNWLLKKIYSKQLNMTRQVKKIAWCYWPKGFEDFDYLNLDIEMIFDTDHNIIDDPNISLENKTDRVKFLNKVGSRANYILSSSRSMLNWYNKHGFLNTKILMNGVFEHRINLSISGHKKGVYTVTYCGTLSKWIKLDWLFRVIKDNPEWNFNFIGQNYKTDIASQLEKFPNVHLLGLLDPIEVDEILKQSDVCLGLYQENAALDVNSMKLYDYLAQNIPVVVNEYHPYLRQDYNNLLNIANNYEDFKYLLANPKNLNNDELIQFLNSSTWNQRIKKILNEINT